MDQQLGRPVLVEFWDFCRANSIRTLPYLKAWHERYAANGLRIIGVHASGFPPSQDPDAVQDAVPASADRLPGGRRHRARDLAALRQPRLAGAVSLQPGPEAVRLPLRRGRLRRHRAGDPGAARGSSGRRSRPLRPEDAPDALLSPQSEDVEGPYNGPYEAGRRVGGARRRWSRAGERPRRRGRPSGLLRAHLARAQHRRASSSSRSAPGVTCYAVCFTPGLSVSDAVEQVDERRAGRPPRFAPRTRHGREIASGRGPRKLGSSTQLPVLSSPAPSAPATPLDRRAASGPARWVWPKIDVGGRRPRADPRPRRRRAALRAAARGPRCRRGAGPRPRAVQRGDDERKGGAPAPGAAARSPRRRPARARQAWAEAPCELGAEVGAAALRRWRAIHA